MNKSPLIELAEGDNYLLSDRQREIIRTAAAVVEAAHGLSFGADWNGGTHAEIYRPKLLAALAALADAILGRR